MITNKINVMQIIYRADIGGGTTCSFQLIRELSKTLFNFTVIIPEEKPYFEKFKLIPNVQVEAFNFKVYNILSLLKLIRKKEIHIIHSHGKGAGIWSRVVGLLSHTAVVHTFHGLHFKQYPFYKKMLYFFIERLLQKITYAHICVSQSEANLAMQMHFTSKNKVVVIGNGIDVNKFKPASIETKLQCREKFGIAKDQVVVGCIARFSVQKNIFFMLECIRSLKEEVNNLVFLFAGQEEDFSFKNIESYLTKNKMDTYCTIVNVGNKV